VLIELFILFEALKSAIVLLIESPILSMLNPMNIELIGYAMISPQSSFEHRSVSQIKLETVFFQNHTSLARLFNTFFGKWHILPTRKSIQLVVSRLAMPHKHYPVSGSTRCRDCVLH